MREKWGLSLCLLSLHHLLFCGHTSCCYCPWHLHALYIPITCFFTVSYCLLIRKLESRGNMSFPKSHLLKASGQWETAITNLVKRSMDPHLARYALASRRRSTERHVAFGSYADCSWLWMLYLGPWFLSHSKWGFTVKDGWKVKTYFEA